MENSDSCIAPRDSLPVRVDIHRFHPNLYDGRMESGGQERTALASNFQHVDLDNLCILIGEPNTNYPMSITHLVVADMLLRLIEHNDKIPLSPYVLL